jgi:hypothetical protein
VSKFCPIHPQNVAFARERVVSVATMLPSAKESCGCTFQGTCCVRANRISQALRTKIYSTSPTKALNGKLLDGTMLCTLAEAYASALNSGTSLNIGDAWSQARLLIHPIMPARTGLISVPACSSRSMPRMPVPRLLAACITRSHSAAAVKFRHALPASAGHAAAPPAPA